MTPRQEHYRMFAGYNAWANARLFSAAARLTDAQYRTDKGAFFGSLHGTLNHLLATDMVWMKRFTGEGEAPGRLDAIVHDELAQLDAARRGMDVHIVQYVQGLDDASLAGTITYRRVSTPEVEVQRLAPALAHWFNHQTHHRGQAHAILTSLGHEGPELDLLFYQRLVARGAEAGWD